MESVKVNFYASARAAAGTGSMETKSATISEIIEKLSSGNEPLVQILAQCSFLVDEISVSDFSHFVKSGSKLDVLPRFAGG